MTVTTGQTVTIEIVAPPRTAAACKTLVRLCRKDPQVARQVELRKRKRPSWQTWRRGGRFWHHQMKSQAPVKLERGQRYSFRATLDVLRDLNSVKRWVKISSE